MLSDHVAEDDKVETLGRLPRPPTISRALMSM